MGKPGKIASVMLVVGFIGLLYIMNMGFERAFQAYEMRSPVSWQDNAIYLVSMVLFFGGALLYIFAWVRARMRR